MSHLLELVDEADRKHDGSIDFEEWEIMGVSSLHSFSPTHNKFTMCVVSRIKQRIPMAEDHMVKVCSFKDSSYPCSSPTGQRVIRSV